MRTFTLIFLATTMLLISASQTHRANPDLSKPGKIGNFGSNVPPGELPPP